MCVANQPGYVCVCGGGRCMVGGGWRLKGAAAPFGFWFFIVVAALHPAALHKDLLFIYGARQRRNPYKCSAQRSCSLSLALSVCVYAWVCACACACVCACAWVCVNCCCCAAPPPKIVIKLNPLNLKRMPSSKCSAARKIPCKRARRPYIARRLNFNKFVFK